MTAVARAQEKGETEGFLKIIVEEKTKQILGASFWEPPAMRLSS